MGSRYVKYIPQKYIHMVWIILLSVCTHRNSYLLREIFIHIVEGYLRDAVEIVWYYFPCANKETTSAINR